MKRKHFLNLSNGVEALAEVRASGEPFAFARFRSTTLEKKDWFTLFESELSDDLLMHLAMGWECILHDRGTRRPLSKTCSFGVPLVCYSLTRRWLGVEPDLAWRGPHGGLGASKLELVRAIYAQTVEAPTPRGGALRRRLDYFQSFRTCSKVSFVGRSESTEHDGDRAYLASLVYLPHPDPKDNSK